MRILTVTLLYLLSSQALFAETAALSDGRVVDWTTPGSEVFIITANGSRIPLWNGVYQLRTGEQFNVGNGVLTVAPWSAEGLPDQSAVCRQLVDRVCGKNGRCSGESACDMARQIATLEREAATDAATGAARPGGESQCEVALRDRVYFKPCE